MSVIEETCDLALLDDFACKDDKILAAKGKKETNSRGYIITDWKAGGNSKIWALDSSQRVQTIYFHPTQLNINVK